LGPTYLALKHIGAELGSSVTQLQWVLDSYNLAYAAFLLTGGTLGARSSCPPLASLLIAAVGWREAYLVLGGPSRQMVI